uniref:F5/8 type C domain-containing protein n=1 Tax=Mesocestoides corti TaxID=53468 RepID=A0A5K3EWS3_MESCO
MIDHWLPEKSIEVFLVCVVARVVFGASCDEALLGNSGLLPDSAFTATSNSETVEQSIAGVSANLDHSAKTARDMLTGGWCPARKISTNLSEFIQVDMGSVNVITQIAFGPRSGVAYTPFFVIRYKRESGGAWRDHKSCSENSTLFITGSEGSLDLKLIALNPPIVARWVRVYPYSRRPMFVCAKFEFYGCKFSDELVEYKIPDGSQFQPSPFSRQLNLRDRCYDGKHDQRSSVLHDGLGCLSDSRVAMPTEAFEVLPWQQPKAPMECLVGWNRSRWEDGRQLAADNKGVVDMVFRFSGLRNFTSLHLYAMDLPLSKIRIPRRIEASFSVDGKSFPSSPDVQVDIQGNSADPLNVALKQKSGRSVQLKLFFADEWIVLSEVRFISVAGNEKVFYKEAVNQKGNDDASIHLVDVESQQVEQLYKNEVPDEQHGVGNDVDYSPLLADVNVGASRPIEAPYQGPTVLVLILVFLCCFMLLLVGIACFSIAWMQKRRKKLQDSVRGLQSNQKLLKAAASSVGNVGLFRWPGLSIGVGGGAGTGCNPITHHSFGNTMNYVTVPNADHGFADSWLLGHRSCSHHPSTLLWYQGLQDGAYFASPGYTSGTRSNDGVPTFAASRPVAKRFLTSFASRLFGSRCGGKPRLMRVFTSSCSSSSAHQYEQVVPQSAHSSPGVTAAVQTQLPARSEALPPFPVVISTEQQQQLPTSFPVHIANGLHFPKTGQPPACFSTLNSRQQNSVQHDSSVVYQSVQGESDADSLAASTMSPEYASASLLGSQSGGGIPFISSGVGDYSAYGATGHHQMVDLVTSAPAVTSSGGQAFFQQLQTGLFYPATAAATFGGGWNPQAPPYINRSMSQQQFHQPFWPPQPGSKVAAGTGGHDVASSANSVESSDRVGGDPASAIYGFAPSGFSGLQ